jgi:hypothetical protein
VAAAEAATQAGVRDGESLRQGREGGVIWAGGWRFSLCFSRRTAGIGGRCGDRTKRLSCWLRANRMFSDDQFRQLLLPSSLAHPCTLQDATALPQPQSTTRGTRPQLHNKGPLLGRGIRNSVICPACTPPAWSAVTVTKKRPMLRP